MRIFNADIMVVKGKRCLVIDAPFSQIEKWLSAYYNKFPCDFEIKEKKKKRSNDANAYMWQLADKIASAVGLTKEEVYQSHIRSVGKFTDILLDNDAVNFFIAQWNTRGIGWFAEIIDNCAGAKTVRAYYGSSVYDTKEMSRLIDNMIQEAKALSEHGVYIETLTPDELAQMMNAQN